MISETEQNLCCYEELLGRSGLLRCCHEFDYSKPKESWRLSPWPELTKQEMGLHTPHQVLLAPKPFAPTCHGPLPAFLACHLCARSPPPKMAGRSTAGRSSACRWRNLHSCCPAFGPLHQSLHTKRAMFSGIVLIPGAQLLGMQKHCYCQNLKRGTHTKRVLLGKILSS